MIDQNQITIDCFKDTQIIPLPIAIDNLKSFIKSQPNQKFTTNSDFSVFIDDRYMQSFRRTTDNLFFGSTPSSKQSTYESIKITYTSIYIFEYSHRLPILQSLKNLIKCIPITYPESKEILNLLNIYLDIFTREFKCCASNECLIDVCVCKDGWCDCEWAKYHERTPEMKDYCLQSIKNKYKHQFSDKYQIKSLPKMEIKIPSPKRPSLITMIETPSPKRLSIVIPELKIMDDTIKSDEFKEMCNKPVLYINTDSDTNLYNANHDVIYDNSTDHNYINHDSINRDSSDHKSINHDSYNHNAVVDEIAITIKDIPIQDTIEEVKCCCCDIQCFSYLGQIISDFFSQLCKSQNKH